MKKSVKYALYGIPIFIGIYLIYRQLRGKKTSGPYVPPNTPEPVVNPVRTQQQVSSGCAFPLKKGVNNCDLVLKLQWTLNHIPITKYEYAPPSGFRPLEEDGDFGPRTEAVLKAYYGDATPNNNIVESQQELDAMLQDVILDPNEFQAAENPYIMAPQPQVPQQPTNPFNPFP